VIAHIYLFFSCIKCTAYGYYLKQELPFDKSPEFCWKRFCLLSATRHWRHKRWSSAIISHEPSVGGMENTSVESAGQVFVPIHSSKRNRTTLCRYGYEMYALTDCRDFCLMPNMGLCISYKKRAKCVCNVLYMWTTGHTPCIADTTRRLQIPICFWRLQRELYVANGVRNMNLACLLFVNKKPV
jgi:hypothetical protein